MRDSGYTQLLRKKYTIVANQVAEYEMFCIAI